MKLKRILIVTLVTVFILAGCASKPPAPPEPPIATPEPAPTTEPEPALPVISAEELTELHTKVLAVRKDAFDLGLPTSHGAEYQAADSVYTTAKAALDKDDRPAAKQGLEEALALFSSLVTREAPLVTAEKARLSDVARDRAYAASAQVNSPVALAAAEAYRSDARILSEEENYRAAILGYLDATTAFDAADKGSKAVTVKARIDSLGFAAMDPGNYQIATTKLEAINREITTSPTAAQDAADESLLRFNLALAKGWEISVGTKRSSAEVYKKQSEAIKAQVAAKPLYADAIATWDSATSAQSAGRHEESATLFVEAEQLFKIAYESAAEKKATADEALRLAEEKTAESAALLEEVDAALEAEE